MQVNTRGNLIVHVHDRVAHRLPTSSVEDDDLTKVLSILKLGWIAVDVDGKISISWRLQSNVGFFSLPVRQEDFEKSSYLEAANMQSGALSSKYLGSFAFDKSKKAGRVS